MATMTKEVYALIKSAKNSDAILNAFWEVSPSGKKETVEFLKSQGIQVVSLPKFPAKSIEGIIARYHITAIQAGGTSTEVLQAIATHMQAIAESALSASLTSE